VVEAGVLKKHGAEGIGLIELLEFVEFVELVT